MAGWFAHFEDLVEPQELPGDVGVVRSSASKYSSMAREVLNAAQAIRNLANDNGNHVSTAVDKLVEVAGDVGDKVERLHDRYASAGSALSAYAGHLETAQHEARAATRDYFDAKGARDAATARANAADDEAQAAGDDDATKQQAQQKQQRQQQAADGHQGDMDAARQRYLAAVRELDTHAQTAHDEIAHAIDDDGLKDSRWDKIKHAVGSVVHGIENVAKKVAHAVGDFIKAHAGFLKALHKVLSWITTGLSIASIFFPVLAPFALGFAAATALVGLGLALTGEMSWLDFGMDALTVVTLGVGAAASGVLKGAAGTARGVIAADGAAGAGRLASISRELGLSGRSLLTGAGKALAEKGVKGALGDVAEFGMAKVPKFAGKLGLSKYAENFGKTALGEKNALGDVFEVMGARGLSNFKNMAVINVAGEVPKSVAVWNNVAKFEGLGSKFVHKGVHYGEEISQHFSNDDAKGYATAHPAGAGMSRGGR